MSRARCRPLRDVHPGLQSVAQGLPPGYRAGTGWSARRRHDHATPLPVARRGEPVTVASPIVDQAGENRRLW